MSEFEIVYNCNGLTQRKYITGPDDAVISNFEHLISSLMGTGHIIELYKRDAVPDRLGLRMYIEIMRGEC